MFRAWAALAVAAAGCYSPAPPSGGYRCDPAAGDEACPSNLQCICGSCVSGPGAAACELDVRIDDAANAPACSDVPGVLCAVENRAFQVTITARAAGGGASSYSGTVELGATWGHARAAAPFQLINGGAQVMVALDRATPPSTSVVVTARAGDAYGESAQSLFVDPAPLTVDPAAAIDTKSIWAHAAVGYPAVDHPAGGYTMFFTGVKQGAAALNASIGRARSGDGVTWTVDTDPVVASMGEYNFSPSVLHVADDDLRLFLSRATSPFSPVTTVQLRSSDGGATFAPMGQELPPSTCSFCDDHVGMLDPWVIVDPTSRSTWLMFFSLNPKAGVPVYTTLGRGRSLDGGATWQLDPVPTPGSGQLLDINLASAPRVVYDAGAGLYRMYYAQARFGQHVDVNNNVATDVWPCADQIQYATSADGEFWTAARNPVGRAAALSPPSIDRKTAGDVPWGEAANPLEATIPYVGLIPGAIEAPDPSRGIDRYSVWFTLVGLRTVPLIPACDPLEPTCDQCDPNMGCNPQRCCMKVECIPFAIGRATRS